MTYQFIYLSIKKKKNKLKKKKTTVFNLDSISTRLTAIFYTFFKKCWRCGIPSIWPGDTKFKSFFAIICAITSDSSDRQGSQTLSITIFYKFFKDIMRNPCSKDLSCSILIFTEKISNFKYKRQTSSFIGLLCLFDEAK